MEKTGIRDGKKSYPGPGKNIPDPQHCQPVHRSYLGQPVPHPQRNDRGGSPNLSKYLNRNINIAIGTVLILLLHRVSGIRIRTPKDPHLFELMDLDALKC
jgi:hypothetical protein